MKPVIYVLEPIGVGGALEANGEVRYFCSEACRPLCPSDGMAYVSYGDSEDYVDGTVCETCGATL